MCTADLCDRFGARDVVVTFAAVTFRPGDYLYADADGLLTAPQALQL